MGNDEFDRCDAEIITMVNRNRYCYPERENLCLMTEAQAKALLKRGTVEPEEKIFEKPEVTRQQLILQLCHGLIPVTIGLAWVLGAMEGLADPAFTSIVAGICMLWGCVEWKWRRVNG